MKRLGVGLIVVMVLLLSLGAVISIGIAENAMHRPRSASYGPNQSVADEISRERHSHAREVSIHGANDTPLAAWWFLPDHPNGDAAIVLHGVADTRLGATGHAGYLLSAGYAVLLPESRGHGASGGELVTYGVLEREDVRRWVAWMRGQGVHAIYGIGISMGAAVILESIPATGFAAVVAESPFSCFDAIASERVHQISPVLATAFSYAQFRYGVDLESACPEHAIAEDKGRTPVLLIHGVDDLNIPISHTRRIAKGAPRSVSVWEVAGAGHVEALGLHYQEYSRRVLAFFEAHGR